ncbi:oxidoreductase [Tabrizicola sp. TH137]|uniref:DUF934 domain-containing protein n=1 Tax=Tabrizicola sp. TH137 TaxID=2067452 RepID=UPI000C7AD47B|nr:DUF934 domain-containing protein [Tabrizicola sp. TH137]PLL13553.1 oxidoreductase [Tabrizicola sp. TH137]
MTVIVTDTGFAPEDWTAPIVVLADIATHQGAVDLSNTDDPTALQAHLADLKLIRVAFPAFNDGRAFTIARRLRMLGYTGRLRAHGPVIADQYAMIRRVGFDEVEIPDDLAARQPAAQWAFRADWKAHDYQSRLRA